MMWRPSAVGRRPATMLLLQLVGQVADDVADDVAADPAHTVAGSDDHLAVRSRSSLP